MRIIANISHVSKPAAWLSLLVLACGVHAQAAITGEPIAHSAQLTVEGSAGATGVTLRVRPAVRAGAPVVTGVTGVSVSFEGRTQIAERRADGSWFVPLPRSLPPGAAFDVLVTHDGIREVLSAKAPAPVSGSSAAGGAAGMLQSHKQVAWWILNIGIVLVAAIAISRRLS